MTPDLIADILHELKKRGISNYQVAKDLGLHKQTVSRWKTHGISNKSLEKLVAYYDVELRIKMGGKDGRD